MARKALARAISSSLALSIFNSGDLSLLRGRGARAFDDDGDLFKGIKSISKIKCRCKRILLVIVVVVAVVGVVTVMVVVWWW